MIPVYALLSLIVALLSYLVYKVRAGATRTFDLHNQVQELRRYDLTELAREVLAGSVLLDLLDLDEPLPPLGGWAASADLLIEVVRRVRRTRPESVVELGSGASTLVIARTLQRLGRGHVYSLDHDADYAARTRSLLEEHGLSEHATVIHAPLVAYARNGDGSPERWYSLEDLPVREIDVLVIDGPPDVPGQLVRLPAGTALFPKLRPGGVVIADDTRRESGQEILRRWAERFPELDVEETSGGKGYAVLSRPGRSRAGEAARGEEPDTQPAVIATGAAGSGEGGARRHAP